MPDEPFEVLAILGPLGIDVTAERLEDVAPAPPVSLRFGLLQRLVPLDPVVAVALPQRVVEDQALDARRVRGGEVRAGRRRLRPADERRALAAGVVHHDADVVHPRLDGEAAGPVRQTHSARVHEEHPPPRRESLREPGKPGRSPQRVDVGQERQEHEVVGTVAERLIGDRDIAAPGVGDVGRVHGRILPSWQ
jgi:hypothetical protein